MWKIAKVERKKLEEIRYRFIVGESLKELSAEYKIPYATIRDYSHKEKWSMFRKHLGARTREEFRRDALDKSYDYINLYEVLRERAERIARDVKNARDLYALVQAVKTIQEQQFILYTIRSDNDEEE